MKFIFAFIFSFFISFGTAPIDSLRDFYPKASASKANADKFEAMASKISGNDAVTSAYKSASKIIQAKFAKGAERKPLLVAGIKGLESAINANPRNVELRIIRLSLQENLPKIVGYNSKMAEDKGVILRNYNNQSASMKQYIREFAGYSKTMTATEKASLK